MGTAYLDINFTPWLRFRSTFGVDYVNLNQHQFSPIFNDKGRNATVSTIRDQKNVATTTLFTEQLTFDKTFGDHHINVTGVFEVQGTKSSQENASGNQNSNDIEVLRGATNVSYVSIKAKTSCNPWWVA